jgi:hypothetical protein
MTTIVMRAKTEVTNTYYRRLIMRYAISRYVGCSAALVISLMPALAFAQQQGATPAQPAPAPAGVVTPDARAEDASAVVIVTGVTQGTSKKTRPSPSIP